MRRWRGLYGAARRAYVPARAAACVPAAAPRTSPLQDPGPLSSGLAHVPISCGGFASSALAGLGEARQWRGLGPSLSFSTLAQGSQEEKQPSVGTQVPGGAGVGRLEDKGTAAAGAAARQRQEGRPDKAEELAGWEYGDVVNAPNMVSLARLVSGPFLGYGIVEGMWGPVLVGVAVASWSDWLDGYLARRLGISSVLGSYLDPLADKALVCSLVVALAHEGLMPLPLAALFLGRDVLLVGGAFAHRSHMLKWRWPGWREYFRLSGAGEAGAMPIMRPLFVSKVNTVLQLSLIGGCITQGAFAWPGDDALWLLGVSTAGTTVVSTGCYVWDYFSGKTLGLGFVSWGGRSSR